MNNCTGRIRKRFKRGRPPRHGGYSLILKSGGLPESRTYLRTYITEVRRDMIRDLGPRESDLTAAARMVLDRAVSKLCIIRVIEEWVKEEGVFKGGELSPVLAKSYITYCESLRRDLLTLGISKRASDQLMDPLKIAADIDARKAIPVSQPGQEEIARPDAPEDAVEANSGLESDVRTSPEPISGG
jgi:hypothetical protein